MHSMPTALENRPSTISKRYRRRGNVMRFRCRLPQTMPSMQWAGWPANYHLQFYGNSTVAANCRSQGRRVFINRSRQRFYVAQPEATYLGLEWLS